MTIHFARNEELQKYQYDCYLILYIFLNNIVLKDLLKMNDTKAYICNIFRELHQAPCVGFACCVCPSLLVLQLFSVCS